METLRARAAQLRELAKEADEPWARELTELAVELELEASRTQ